MSIKIFDKYEVHFPDEKNQNICDWLFHSIFLRILGLLNAILRDR